MKYLVGNGVGRRQLPQVIPTLLSRPHSTTFLFLIILSFLLLIFSLYSVFQIPSFFFSSLIHFCSLFFCFLLWFGSLSMAPPPVPHLLPLLVFPPLLSLLLLATPMDNVSRSSNTSWVSSVLWPVCSCGHYCCTPHKSTNSWLDSFIV